MRQSVARIIKREFPHGTHHISQRWVPKFRWFGIGKKQHHWESFKMSNSAMSGITFQSVSSSEEKFSVWQDAKVAEFYCTEWTRYSQPDLLVKTWTVEK